MLPSTGVSNKSCVAVGPRYGAAGPCSVLPCHSTFIAVAVDAPRMDVTVRPARPDDAAAVRRVAERSWHEAHDHIVGPETVEAFIDEFYAVEMLRERVHDDDAVFLVAESGDGAVVGFVEAVPDGDDGDWELNRIYADPDAWGRGVGSRLLERLESDIRSRGGTGLRLVVMADNDVGVGFYESAGFERVGDHYDEYLEVDGYVYAKSL